MSSVRVHVEPPPGGRRWISRSVAAVVATLAAGVLAASGAPPGRAALPPCNVGAITVTAAPSLSAPSPAYTGSTITSSSGAFTSCGSSITGFYKEWLRNGAVVSGPTWTTGGTFSYSVGAADVGAGIRSGVQPCNADGCYGSYVLSSNTITPANRAPAVPTALAPVDGTSADSLTPALSAKFSDPDGQSGHASFVVRRSSDGSLVASGNGSTVGSGGTSKWTVPAGKLTMGGKYRWTVTAVDASGAGSGSAGPAWYGANAIWLHDSCATDGSASGTSASCQASTDLTEDPPSADSCTGTDGFCDATDDQIAAAGVSTAPLDASEASEENRGVSSIDGGASQVAAGFTGRWGWLTFDLVRSATTTTCSDANPVAYNGYCGYLWHQWRQYVNGFPTSGAGASRFFARSGDNLPTDKWTVNVGPLPDVWAASTYPANEQYHHWGWQNGRYQGYSRISDSRYYPGGWPIDPGNVYDGTPGTAGVTVRNGFMIHGGWQGHAYEESVTHGCIRIRYQAIPALRSKWDNRTDNRRISPGPTLYVYYAS